MFQQNTKISKNDTKQYKSLHPTARSTQTQLGAHCWVWERSLSSQIRQTSYTYANRRQPCRTASVTGAPTPWLEIGTVSNYTNSKMSSYWSQIEGYTWTLCCLVVFLSSCASWEPARSVPLIECGLHSDTFMYSPIFYALSGFSYKRSKAAFHCGKYQLVGKKIE